MKDKPTVWMDANADLFVLVEGEVHYYSWIYKAETDTLHLEKGSSFKHAYVLEFLGFECLGDL